MSPASGNEPLRGVGPQRVDEGGELAGDAMSLQHQGQTLIQAVAAANPPELTTYGTWPEDGGRTRYLDDDEVEKAVEDADWSDEVDVGKVLGARVHGYGKPVEEKMVVVLFEVEGSGRDARGAVPYDDLSKSKKAYEEAVKSEEYKPGQADSIEQLRSSNEAMAAEMASLRRQLAGQGHLAAQVAGAGAPPGSLEATPVPEGTAAEVAAAVESGDLTDEQLDALEARDERKTVQAAIQKQRGE